MIKRLTKSELAADKAKLDKLTDRLIREAQARQLRQDQRDDRLVDRNLIGWS